jgi:AcrR family transcriptional regulator
MAASKRKTAPRDEELAARIVDTAIAMAEEEGWDNVRLRRVADALGITLAELGRHFRDLDAVADAWLARARAAMLAPLEPEFAGLAARERLKILIWRWFDALAPHREVTVQMLRTKMWPYHPHHYVPMIFNLSRTIQWLRDAGGLDAGGRRRQIEEIGLTGLFLATLAVWARDDTLGQERTRRFLDRRLARADMLMAVACRRRRREPERD